MKMDFEATADVEVDAVVEQHASYEGVTETLHLVRVGLIRLEAQCKGTPMGKEAVLAVVGLGRIIDDIEMSESRS